MLDLLVDEEDQDSIAVELASFIQNGKLLMAKGIILKLKNAFTGWKLKPQQRNLEAGAAFESFLKEYPDNKDYPNLMLVAADNYESAGNTEKANEIYKSFVDKYPTHEKAAFQLFRIASNYRDALDYENAIEYYNTLYETTEGRGKPFENAKGALYNIALMKIGVGDFSGAASGLEDYAKRHAEPDKESIAYSAGIQWEKVNPRRLLVYQRYLDTYAVNRKIQFSLTN